MKDGETAVRHFFRVKLKSPREKFKVYNWKLEDWRIRSSVLDLWKWWITKFSRPSRPPVRWKGLWWTCPATRPSAPRRFPRTSWSSIPTSCSSLPHIFTKYYHKLRPPPLENSRQFVHTFFKFPSQEYHHPFGIPFYFRIKAVNITLHSSYHVGLYFCANFFFSS